MKNTKKTLLLFCLLNLILVQASIGSAQSVAPPASRTIEGDLDCSDVGTITLPLNEVGLADCTENPEAMLEANGDLAIAALPVSGTPVPQLAVFDQVMQQYMSERNIKAGTLTISRNGVVIFERGYGWRDRNQQIQLPPNALFRLASVVKPFTSAAIKKLIQQGKLRASDKVFCLPGTVGKCHLMLQPIGTPDSRLKDVTIQHLLEHRGGWNREVSGDPMFQSITIARAIGVPSPPTKQQTARYMMGRPLDFTPGQQEKYSNFGYMLLGLMIEKVTKKSYTAHVQAQLFKPLGVASSEITLGRTLPQNRNPREPWYSSRWFGLNVFNPSESVPWPDGGWYLQAMDSHGGLIATGRAVTKFLDRYWISGEPRQGTGQHWWFFGSLDGTFTLAYQHLSGVNLVALFNQRDDPSGLPYDVIKGRLDEAVTQVAQWPVQQVQVDNAYQDAGEQTWVAAADVDALLAEEDEVDELEGEWIRAVEQLEMSHRLFLPMMSR